MRVFYMFSLPMTIGMVIFTLRYFSGPDVPKYVLFTVAYAWFCSISIIILVPADIWTVFSIRIYVIHKVHDLIAFYLIVFYILIETFAFIDY